MTSHDASARKPNYGLDAPKVVLNLALVDIACLALGLAWRAARTPLVFQGLAFLAMAGVMLWGSYFGKRRLRDQILESIPWRGDERVLDVGCGHGLMLIGAAKRVPSGRAVGIDIWSQEDQKSNSVAATLENARREGVAGRIEVVNADMRKIPFPDNSFDVVLSSFAVHNLYDRAQREQALREIARVLKSGGRLVIADIRHVPEYERCLRRLDWIELERRGTSYLFVIPTRTLHAVKP